MPISPALISHAEIQIHGTVTAGGSNNRLTVATFHYRRTAVVNPLSKANLDTAFDAAITAKIALLLNNRWTQSFNTIRWLDDAEDPPLAVSHAAVGAIAGDGMSTVVASYMLFRTAKRGRSFRGSKHLFPLSESDTTAGTEDILNAACLARYASLITALATPLVDASGNTWNGEVVAKTLSQLRVNPTTIIGNDITQILVNKRIGRMRKREVKSVY